MDCATLRCRRCRRAVVDFSCLLTAKDDCRAAGCSIWHVDADNLPEWIQTRVQQALWTAGKLKCCHCGGRLGGFSFLSRSICPCGRDAAVHLSRSRVDLDRRRNVPIVWPRSRGSRTGRVHLSDLRGSTEETNSLQLIPTEALVPVSADENPQHGAAGLTDMPVPDSSVTELRALRRSRLSLGLQQITSEGDAELKESQSSTDYSPDSEDEDRNRLTCAVCLDIFFRPHSCRPCSHVFCEPCLRRLAKNRTAETPCPLCRSVISYASLHRELEETARSLFPKVWDGRQQNFQSSPCARWPLPTSPEQPRFFWGYGGRAATPWRRWPFSPGAFNILNLPPWASYYADMILFILALLFLFCLSVLI